MKFGIREIIFVMLMLGVLGSANFLVFKKNSADRAAKQAEITQKQQQLGSLQEATAGIPDLTKKTEELQQAINFFESKLPQEKEIDTILKEVWQMAEANSLQTKTIKTLRSERGPNYREQPIQMSLSGDFNGFYAFLLQLEKLARITRVTQMNLQKIDEHDGQMQAQMTLSIFFDPAANAQTVANAN